MKLLIAFEIVWVLAAIVAAVTLAVQGIVPGAVALQGFTLSCLPLILLNIGVSVWNVCRAL